MTDRFRARCGALVVLMVSVLVLAACGSDSGDAGQRSGTGTGQFPVTIDHMYGRTTITSEPTRIVTLGLSDQDPLLALGVKPIAVSQWYGDYPSATWPWAQDELGDSKPVVLNKGVRDEANPPIEEIASLKPDLILSLYNGITKAQYDQLSRIAPTVVPTKEFADFTITWQEATRVTGKALGRESDATALIAKVDADFSAAAAAHPNFQGKRVVVAERFEPGESVVRSGNDIRARFFSQLGFVTPTEVAGVKPDEYGEIKVSDELITDMSRDLLVWNIGDAPEKRSEIERIPLYRTLPVVTAGKVLWVTDPLVSGAFSWGTVLSLPYALEKLLPQISETVG